MAKAKKLPSGSWRCQVYDYTDNEGKRHYESFTASTRKEAEYMAAEFALNKRRRIRPDKTFGQALDDYISEREPVLSPRTIRNYKYIRQNDIPSLMGIKVSDINQKIIQKVINEDSAAHSPKTVRDHHGLIYAVLKQERPDFALNTILPPRVRPNLYIPSDEEVKAVIDCAKGTELEIPILLAAFGPMRRGEICALESDCIAGNIVHVTKNMVLNTDGKWIIKQPKTYSGDRYIEFPDFVIDILSDKTGRITDLNPDALTCRFRRLIKKADVHPFRFHDLRHYCASVLHAIGVPDAYIMQRGGWQNDGVLKEVYRHAMEDKQKAMNDKANSYFKDLCNTKCNTKLKNP